MNILPINYKNYFNYTKNSVKMHTASINAPFSKTPPLGLWNNYNSVDTVEFKGKTDLKKDEAIFDDFINRPGIATREELDKMLLNRNVVNIAKEYTDKNSVFVNNTTPGIVAKAALALKTFFDDNVKNYRIISLGTSPSIICEAMEYMGAEVIYLPISGLKDLEDSEEDGIISKGRNIQVAMDYLKGKGLGKKDDDKMNIVIDYKATGRTLKRAIKYIKHYCNIDDSKILECDLLAFLNLTQKFANVKDEHRLSDLEIMDLSFMVRSQNAELISNVPHFYVKDQENYDEFCVYSDHKKENKIYNEFKTFSRPLARAYSLCAADKLNEMINEN